MNISAFILAWNEEETIHLTLKHYRNFCNEITLLDNHSTDRTVEIAKHLHCKVKTFGVPGVLDDRTYLDVKNECWKKAHNGIDRRDYVIVCDADEILSGYPTDKIYSVWDTVGRDVFSYGMPVSSWFEIDNSHFCQNYSKNIIFDPKRITESNYRIGAHTWSPRGEISVSPNKIFLFHFRNVGGPQRLIDRHKLYRERMSEENKNRKFGIHYLYSDEQRVNEWEEKFQRSKPFLQGIGVQ